MHYFTKNHGRFSIQSIADKLDMVCSNESHYILFFYKKSIQHKNNTRFGKVLRVLDLASPLFDDFPSCIIDLCHVWYLRLTFDSTTDDRNTYIPSSIAHFMFRNNIRVILPLDIFKMSLLIHLSLDRNYLDQHHKTREKFDYDKFIVSIWVEYVILHFICLSTIF